MSKFCTKCGKELSDDSLFCSACGSKQDEVNSAIPSINTYNNTTTQKKLLNKDNLLPIIRCGLVALLSLIMFIFSFLPITTIEYEYGSKKINIQVTAIDNASFMFSSFYSLSQDEIEESDLYYNNVLLLEDLQEELFDADEITPKLESLINKYIKNTISLTLMHENAETDFRIISLGVISLLYLFISLITLIVSLLKLLMALKIIQKETIKNLGIKFSLATFILCILVTVLSNSYFKISYLETLIGYGSLTIIITACIIYIALIILNYIFKEYNSKVYLPLKIISLAIALTLILLSTSPILIANIRTKFAGKDTKRELSVDVYDNIYNNLIITNEDKENIYDIMDMTKEEKREYFENLFKNYSYFTTLDIKEGKANGITSTIATTLLKVKTDSIIRFVLSLYPYIAFATIIFASILLYQNLIYLLLGKNLNFVINLCKIFTLVGTVLTIATNIALTIILNYISDGYISDITFSLGASTIISTLIAFILVFIPSKSKNKINGNFETFNNF